MTEHAVVIAGGGPTGMMLAAELALAGTDVVVVERRPDHDLDGSRAGGLHSRTIEVLDQRGVADRFVAEGQALPAAASATTRSTSATSRRATSTRSRSRRTHIERILAALGRRARRAGAPRPGGDRLRAGRQASTSSCPTATTLRAAYLVGCDGGRSLVRKTAGIEFPGWDATSELTHRRGRDARGAPIGIRREGGGIRPRQPDARTARPCGSS